MRDQTLSAREVADLLGCSVVTVRKMIRRKSLIAVGPNPTTKNGYRIRRAEVESILSARKRVAKKAG